MIFKCAKSKYFLQTWQHSLENIRYEYNLMLKAQ